MNFACTRYRIFVLLLVLLLISTMGSTAFASCNCSGVVYDSNLQERDLALFESAGVDFSNLSSVSSTNVVIRTSSQNAIEIPVIKFDFSEDGVGKELIMMPTDEDGNPVNTERLERRSGELTNYGTQYNGSSMINYMAVYVEYQMYSDGLSVVYVNPKKLSFWSTSNCTNVTIAYAAIGDQYTINIPDVSLYESDSQAVIGASYSSISANIDYVLNGNNPGGYALPYGRAILISFGNSETHGVSAYYTAANGVYYYSSFPFNFS